MQWMGVYGNASEGGGDVSSWFVKPESAILPHVDRVGLEERVKRIEGKINVMDVEKILGYKFRWRQATFSNSKPYTENRLGCAKRAPAGFTKPISHSL